MYKKNKKRCTYIQNKKSIETTPASNTSIHTPKKKHAKNQRKASQNKAKKRMMNGFMILYNKNYNRQQKI
jgi:hypothetical protein